MGPNLPTPEQSPEPSPAPAPVQVPTPNGQPPKKLGTGAIIAIAGGAVFLVLLIIGIVVAVSAMTAKDNTDTRRNDDSSKADDATKEDTPTRKPVTAKMLVELQTVCVGGSVTNTKAFTKPYRYVVFYNNNSRNDSQAVREQMAFTDLKYDWFMFTAATNDTSIELTDRSDPSEFNVVTCLDRDESTAVKTMTCELLRSPGMKRDASTVADYHSVKYKVKLYEAQSGKKIKELAPINGPATECPRDTYYTPENPDIYGDPDITELETRLEEFDK